ncbi:MAG: S9 family peptidase [Pseudomonadota bacterium]
MRFLSIVTLVLTVLFMVGCSEQKSEVSPQEPQPPTAAKKAKELEIHGDVRIDNYYWLNERENPEVIQYLEAENAYLDTMMAPTKDLQKELYDEIVGRLKQDDASVPFEDDGYYYYWRFAKGGEYRIWSRRKESLEGEEEILFDGNVMAEGTDFFALRGLQISSNHNIASYAVDTEGRRKYTRRFRNLENREDYPEALKDVTPNGAWANDNKTYFYTRQDPQTLRWYQIYRHEVGTDPSEDTLVYQEDDEEFSCYVYKTKSEAYLVIGCFQTLSTENWVLDANNPKGEFQVVQPREENHEYDIDHLGDHFYMKTNWDAPNFRLMKTPVAATTKDNWEEVLAHREDTFIAGYDMFKDYMVVSERRGALNHMRIHPYEGEAHYLDFGEPAYDANFGTNVDIDSGVLRYSYTSLTTPNSVYDYDMATRTKTLLKEQEVVGEFDKNDYTTERLQVPARDGTLIPVSLVYKNGFEKNGKAPLLQYGYGSYGSTIDPSFRSYRLSLLNRGFVFAIAHIRGSQVNGRAWYEEGKLLNKKNTFTDFVDVGRHLVKERYTSSDRLFAEGGSAGGLLMGAVTNMAPDLWQGVASHVPFVDVITTMLDDSIPLTTGEWDEWGNPKDKEFYDYMLSYSPYDQLEAKNYPNILVTTGLEDSQVQYWEPAKYVAKMRELKTDDNLLLLKTNMKAGHGGASGRFRQHEETAMVYAFFLSLIPNE